MSSTTLGSTDRGMPRGALVLGLFFVLAVIAIVAGVVSASASASPAMARWAIEARAMPTHITAVAGGKITVLVTNRGGAPTDGQPVRILDTLPLGLTLTANPSGGESPNERTFSCESTPGTPTVNATVTCTYDPEPEPGVGIPLPGENTDGIEVLPIEVSPEPGHVGTLTNTVTVSGGGASSVTVTDPVVVGEPEAAFAFNGGFEAGVFDAAGLLDSQAADHPNIDTTGFVLDSVPSESNAARIEASQEVRDVVVELPVGLVGDPQAAPTCPEYLVAPPGDGTQCPAASVVGTVAAVRSSGVWGLSGKANESNAIRPLFNVPPEHGHPAQFAFLVEGQQATLYASLVHTPAGYTIRVTSSSIPRAAELTAVKVTLFGDPAAQDAGAVGELPFFTNPSDCAAGPLTTTVHADSWQHPGAVNPDSSPNLTDPAWQTSEATSPPLTGCEKLQFNPQIDIKPTASAPDTPSGLNVNLKIAQNPDPKGLATPDLKKITVTLPQGLAIDPSSANGLAACSDTQFAAESTEPAACPEPSVLGSVTARTPLLADTLHGRIFLGTPECDPCSNGDAQSGRMIRLLLEITDPARGVDVKLQGNVNVDPNTGRLTATFDNNPQLPVEELQTKLKEDSTAPLATPSGCGTYRTTSELEPWSHDPAPGEASGTPNATLEPSFTIAGCAAQGFAPSFLAGTTNNQAGGYSPLTLSFARNDNEQDFNNLEMTLPPGLLAKIAGVQRCGEVQANAGTCPQAAEIGTVTVGAGAGATPYYVTGHVYLTGPTPPEGPNQPGGPFGEVVEVPAVAGPFNLGTVVVRGSIRIDPTTAQATIVSNPFPTILDGIPLQVRSVSVTLNREGFTFNPTSCNPQAVTGKLTSTAGTAANVSSHYQAASCASLAFKPGFSASTAGRASKTGGASLDVKVTYPKGPFGTYANIKSVKVDLPKQLPSRLSTLQKACTAKVFEANPAGCPTESDVGTATATTPLLNVPLSGPAYLVSHGGEAFPDLEIVLQGEGVTLILVGNTQIKKGITSSTFKSIPDAPVSGFELKLPTGKYSILGANVPQGAKYSLCRQKLAMPTAITGQNGAPIKQTTKIAVTGCPRKAAVKKKRSAKKHRKAQGKARKGKRR